MPFARVVREVAREYKTDLRFQVSAIKALQEAAERYLITRMEMGQLAAIHRKVQTLMAKDWIFPETMMRFVGLALKQHGAQRGT